ncbi:iron-sulfur cluster assembly scaffold protein [Candidatus Woesearchaeota archaeon]|nr:iron-sulfur cluster assembly scaffold protein [Candidatus Woesearchaeota archaeon]
MYSKTLIEHFKNPKHVGEMKNPDGVGEEGNMRCGDIMKIFIKVKKDVIVDISFLTYGCMAAIAASDMMCEMAKGKKLDDAMKISYKEIVNHLGEMPKIKYHCSVLGTQALKNAIKNYRKNENK